MYAGIFFSICWVKTTWTKDHICENHVRVEKLLWEKNWGALFLSALEYLPTIINKFYNFSIFVADT